MRAKMRLRVVLPLHNALGRTSARIPLRQPLAENANDIKRHETSQTERSVVLGPLKTFEGIDDDLIGCRARAIKL